MHTPHVCILIFVIEIISLYLPKAPFVAFLPFKFSYSWIQFVFEICQDNALLKYCTASFSSLYIKSVTFNKFPFSLVLFHNYSSLLSQRCPQELPGFTTKINCTLQVMPPRDLPSRETQGKEWKQNNILHFFWNRYD